MQPVYLPGLHLTHSHEVAAKHPRTLPHPTAWTMSHRGSLGTYLKKIKFYPTMQYLNITI